MLQLVRVIQTDSVKTKKLYSEALEVLANNLKRSRQAKGYTQEDMVEFGFNYRHYQKIESGAYSPSFQTLHRLALALDVSVGDLVKGV